MTVGAALGRANRSASLRLPHLSQGWRPRHRLWDAIRRASRCVLLWALVPVPMAAQSVPRITPGHSSLHPAVVAAGVDTLALVMVLQDGGERHVSTVIRTTRATVESGVEAWVMVQSYEAPGAISSDTAVVRRSDLAPLRYAAVLPGETQRFTFHPQSIEGTVQRLDSASRTVHVAAAVAVFNAVMDIDVIRALPLSLGFAAELASYNPPAESAHATHIRVLRLDTIPTATGNLSAWAVAYRSTGAPTIVWVGRDERQFVALRAELSDGASFWKLHRRDLAAWRTQRVSSAADRSGRSVSSNPFDR